MEAESDLKRAKKEEVEENSKRQPKEENVECEGAAMGNLVALDKYGFAEVDGNKYLDDTCPSDFSVFNFMEGKQAELANKYYQVRWAQLRGRSKKDGSLYSSPSIFLQKEWQGKYLSFTLPDKHVTHLRNFLDEVTCEQASRLT